MSSADNRWHTVDALFAEALDHPPEERAAFLDAACGDDAELRDAVAQLLAASDASATFLESARALDWAAPLLTPPEAPDTQVGPYRIERELGRGGMGTVYLATRDDVHKQVALKLVRAPLADPARIGRFLQERTVLAQLEHPHIARLLDAGPARRPTARPISRWNTLTAARSIATATPTASRSTTAWRCSKRCARPSSMRTRTSWCTATSSRATSSSRTMGR
ncbi:MAG: protein kinase [Bacteroidetes bacterium]|nr:protein kinase [Bacteroidota bacterium]